MTFLTTLLSMKDRGVKLPKNQFTKRETDIGQAVYHKRGKVQSVVQLPNMAKMYEFFSESKKDGNRFGEFAKYERYADGKIIFRDEDGALADEDAKGAKRALLALKTDEDTGAYIEAPDLKIDPKSNDTLYVKAGFSLVTTETGAVILLVSGHFESGAGDDKEMLRHMQRLAVEREVSSILAQHPEISKVAYAIDSNQSAAVPRGQEKPDPDLLAKAAQKAEAEEQARSQAEAQKSQKPGKRPKKSKEAKENKEENTKTEESVVDASSVKKTVLSAKAPKAVNTEDPNLTPDDFVVDTMRLKEIAHDLGGRRLVLEHFGTAPGILNKTRFWLNGFQQQQSTKGDMDWSNKAQVVIYDVVQKPKAPKPAEPQGTTKEELAASKAANETAAQEAHEKATTEWEQNFPNYQKQAIDNIVGDITVPRKKIITFGSKKGVGVDHLEAEGYAEGVHITVQPLIKSSQERGFQPWQNTYKRKPTPAYLKQQHECYKAMLVFILVNDAVRQALVDDPSANEAALALVQSKAEKDLEGFLNGTKTDEQGNTVPLDGVARRKLEKKTVEAAGNALDELDEEQTVAVLTGISEMQEYQAVAEWFVEEPLTPEKRAKLAHKICWTKDEDTGIEKAGPVGRNKRLDTINEGLNVQTDGGFPTPEYDIRQRQLRHLGGLISRSDIVVTTEDGPENHADYDFEMATLLGQLEQRTFQNITTSMVLGAALGAGAALVLGVAMPVVATAAAGMAFLGGVTYYTSCGASKAQTKKHNDDLKKAADEKKAAAQAKAEAKAKAKKAAEPAKQAKKDPSLEEKTEKKAEGKKPPKPAPSLGGGSAANDETATESTKKQRTKRTKPRDKR